MTRKERRIYWFFAIELIGVTFLQKIALPIGDDAGISLALPLMALGVAALLALGDLEVDVDKLVLFSIFAFFAAAAHILQVATFSLAAFALCVLIYAFTSFTSTVTRQMYVAILNIFQRLMICAAGITIIQNLWQLVFGWPDFFNVENFIPPSILFPGFTYIQPLYYGANIIKPPGLFLEVSLLSQFLAVALVIETLFFQRWGVLGILFVGMLSAFAGSGPLTLLLVAPVVLFRSSAKLVLGAFFAVAIAILIVQLSGNMELIYDRLEEFNTPDTSAFLRFTAPLVAFSDYLKDDGWVYRGIGAGNIEKAPNIVWWAANKLFREYGLLTALSWLAMLLFAMFKHAPNVILSATMLIVFQFMGGYLSIPPVALLLILLTCILRVSDATEQTPPGAPFHQSLS